MSKYSAEYPEDALVRCLEFYALNPHALVFSDSRVPPVNSGTLLYSA